MKTSIKKLILNSLIIAPLFFMGACATKIQSTVLHNPPPEEKFSNFHKFEMAELSIAKPYDENEANQKAVVKIQEYVNAIMRPMLVSWHKTAEASNVETKRTLVILPEVAEIKFIGGAARFWVGAMAGSSAVIVRAKIMEKETGKIIATPEFYAKADSRSGAWTMGGADNAMLNRIAIQLTDYLMANYAAEKGGPAQY